jgi:hypothetical protein
MTRGLKLIKKSKSLSPGEIKTLVKNATPEARWRHHSAWMKANQTHLDESVFNKLDEVRELLDEAPQNSRLILALLKILDEFKARFDLQPLAAKGGGSICINVLALSLLNYSALLIQPSYSLGLSRHTLIRVNKS